MTVPQITQRMSTRLRAVPRKHFIYGGVGLALLLYGVNFFIPRQVAFSFAGQTCHKQLTILPGLHKSDDASYLVTFKDTWNVGSFELASKKTCFDSKVAPTQGSSIVGVAPFNGPLARTMYNVTTAKTPAPQLKSVKADVPVSKSLRIAMSGRDTVHDYQLTVAGKTVECKANSAAIDCDIPSLKLAQGESYKYTVSRLFKKSKPANVGSGTFKTLRAVTVAQSSVSAGQTVYARPTAFTVATDKPITAAVVAILADGKPAEAEQKIEGNIVTLILKSELPREKTFELTAQSIEATDGSTLVEPYKVTFKTSGGPKVSDVSVGPTSVGQSAVIVLTFDQPLSKTKDVLPFITFGGGRATVQKRSDTQYAIQLASLPLCQPFTITVKKGVSSEHDLASAADWNFASRTICYQTTTYGTSIKDRPLSAYIFGSSGPVTMYVGGIHGSEPSSTKLMRAWIIELESNPSRFAGKRIVVVPAINPDGLAAGTRTNSRGVNLNRNFPTDNWIKSIRDTDGNNASGGGDAPLSEPEAAALAKLTTSYKPRLLLSFHAIGSIVIGDPGGYSAGYASKYASQVGYRDGTSTSSSNFDYNVTGGYEDWTYAKVGIPSMVIELSSYTSIHSAGHYNALWSMLD